MIRNELEQRIRNLEKGIDQFEGMEWIVKVGELAEIKSALFDMPDSVADLFETRITASDLARLDDDIAHSLDNDPPSADRRKAFSSACRVLRRWLEPSFPGLRPAHKTQKPR